MNIIGALDVPTWEIGYFRRGGCAVVTRMLYGQNPGNKMRRELTFPAVHLLPAATNPLVGRAASVVMPEAQHERERALNSA